MRRLENFVKVFVWTNIMIAVMLVADLLVITFLGMRSEAGMTKLSPAYLSGEISRTVNEDGETQYSMSRQGTEAIDVFHGFAFVLDDAGDVVWSYQLPDDVPGHFTPGDIVRFSRYYLNDYPVYTHILDDGVLVAGLPRQTVWKYHLSFQISTVEMLFALIPILLVVNIAALLIGPSLIIRRGARRREKQRTSWIAGVSHDIRTPLSLVLGYADELLHSAQNSFEGVEGGSIAGHVEKKAQLIEQQALRIRTLVTNLNTSNKLAYGMGVWQRESVLLPALLRESVCGVINRGIDEKYDISVIIPEALEQLYIKGDRELVMRLVENLLNNAINHNPQGCGITVSLAIRRLWIFKRIVLEISETGRGVSREQLNYFRSSMKLEKLPEHGLGIRVARQIALFHRWRLRFLNDEDGGFVCRIDLTPAAPFKSP